MIEPGIRASSANCILVRCNCCRYRIQLNSDNKQPSAKIGAGRKLGLINTKIGEAITANPNPEILCKAAPAVTTSSAIISNDGSINIVGIIFIAGMQEVKISC